MSRGLLACALVGPLVISPAVARGADAPAPAGPPESQRFTIDPVADGVLIGAGVGFSQILARVISTGELKPTLPADSSVLLSIDRIAVTQTIGPHAAMYSNIGLVAAYGYAVLDPVMSGFRDGPRALLVDGIMYAESISITWVATDLTKVAVRRPRPVDYVTCAASKTEGCASDTNLQLSFFSGHASVTGTISATATYLAFIRAPHTPRPWITLGVGIALTTFVSYQRVRSGDHFPTDVIMGSLGGAAIGVLVPHFHRRRYYHEDETGAAPTWLGFTPSAHGGGSVAAGWIF